MNAQIDHTTYIKNLYGKNSIEHSYLIIEVIKNSNPEEV